MWATLIRLALGEEIFQGQKPGTLLQRGRFLLNAFSNREQLSRMLTHSGDASLRSLLRDRPQSLGVLVWPYQCIAWNSALRLDRLCKHYEAAAPLGELVNFPVDCQRVLLELEEIRSGLKVILDQPTWFMREGQLTINLFQDETRLYSLAFSLCPDEPGPVVYIGALQGRDIEGALDQYRELTKLAHGMRPRDLLLEIFRMLCVTIGVSDIRAVSNEFRIHQSRYFGDAGSKKLHADYNEIWRDRGGEQIDPTFYRLPLRGERREITDIPAKKRAMYRHRYEMLSAIAQRLGDRYLQTSI